jgi:hypothetical protein
VCETPGCDTVLSNYNPARFCSLHDALSGSVLRSGSRTVR